MFISNELKSNISYRHKVKIKQLFEDYVHGDLEIDHFSINIFFGNGQNIFLSPTPEMANELCKHNFVDKDSNYSPDVYQKFFLYPWRSIQRHETDKLINFIKEEKFKMRSGLMLVRDLGGGRHVMYSVATHRRDNPDFPDQFKFLFHCKANYIAQMGDFLYDSLLPIINEYGSNIGVEMPKILNAHTICLESSFCNDEQIQLYEKTKDRENIDFIKEFEKMKKSTFKLKNGGRVER